MIVNGKEFKIVPYISKERIDKRILELSKIITNDYKGKKLKVIGILKGSVPFMDALLQNVDNELIALDYMCVSSYRGTESTGVVRILKDLDYSISGEDVIIVEDIIDTGNTLNKVIEILKTRNPKSIKVATLLDKPSRREVDIKADYVGFEIEDKFVAGFGLDYEQYLRQLPYIGVVEFI